MEPSSHTVSAPVLRLGSTVMDDPAPTAFATVMETGRATQPVAVWTGAGAAVAAAAVAVLSIWVDDETARTIGQAVAVLLPVLAGALVSIRGRNGAWAPDSVARLAHQIRTEAIEARIQWEKDLEQLDPAGKFSENTAALTGSVDVTTMGNIPLGRVPSDTNAPASTNIGNTATVDDEVQRRADEWGHHGVV